MATETAPKATGSPQWQSKVKDRLKTQIKRYQKPLAELRARDANEGDTRLFLTDFLCEALGYDKYADMTTEYAVKSDFADYGLRVDKQLVAFFEAKRASTKLSEKHLRQVQMYGVNEGVEWLILSNGIEWQVYHLAFNQPVETTLVLSVDLLSDQTVSQKAEALFYLSRESMKRRQIDDLWKTKLATSPKSLGATILSEPIVEAIRKELRRKTTFRVDPKELRSLLRETVLRPESLG